MATPSANCPTCSGAGRYLKSELIHHGDCTHYFWCDDCDEGFSTTVTGVDAARKAFFGTDVTKPDELVSLEKIVGDAGRNLS